MSAMLMVAAFASTASPSPLETFGDWSVGCDNGAICQAVSLAPSPPAQGTRYLPVAITIGPGPNPDVTIQIDIKPIPTGEVVLWIQDEPVITAQLSSGSYYVNDAAAIGIFAPMTLATTPVVVKVDETTLGSFSVSGISATLRYVDQAQGRAGTQSAFVATGPAPATSTPPAPPLPVVKQAQPSTRAVQAPTAAAIASLQAQYCGDPPSGTASPTTAPLDEKNILTLLPCGLDQNPAVTGVNYRSIALVDGGTGPQLADFDVQPGWGYNPAFPAMLNASYDAEVGTLTEYAKRSSTDICGVKHSYIWDGASFRLLLGEELDDCRGAASLITTWRSDTSQ